MRRRTTFFVLISTLLICSPSVNAFRHSTTTKHLRVEISLLHFLNNLGLSQKQLLRLEKLSRKGGNVWLKYNKMFKRADAYELQALRTYRNRLIRDGHISKKLRRRIALLQKRIRIIKDSFQMESQFLLDDVRKILTPPQMRLAAEYQPCILTVPPKHGGPVGANNATGVTRLLKRMHRMRPYRFQRVLKRVLKRFDKRLTFLPKKRVKRIKWQVRRTLIRMRRLSKVDFQLQLPQIAKKVDIRRFVPNRRGKRLNRFLARHFFHPRMANLMRIRIRYIRKNRRSGPGMAKVVPGRSCKDGICKGR